MKSSPKLKLLHHLKEYKRNMNVEMQMKATDPIASCTFAEVVRGNSVDLVGIQRAQ